jgi:hypothetical protein
MVNVSHQEAGGGAFLAFKGKSAALAAVAAANAITADVMIFFIAERPKNLAVRAGPRTFSRPRPTRLVVNAFQERTGQATFLCR